MEIVNPLMSACIKEHFLCCAWLDDSRQLSKMKLDVENPYWCSAAFAIKLLSSVQVSNNQTYHTKTRRWSNHLHFLFNISKNSSFFRKKSQLLNETDLRWEKHKKTETDATRIGEGRFWSLQTGFVAASHLLLIFINARRLLKKLPLMTPLFFCSFSLCLG